MNGRQLRGHLYAALYTARTGSLQQTSARKKIDPEIARKTRGS